MTNEDWSCTAERVTRLAAHPGAGSIFGADGHHWQMKAPVTVGELAEAEAQLRVELPGEYRSFLLHVSRGGAGPAYGLFPFDRADGVWRWDGDGADLTDLETLSRPFPHTDAFNPADGLPGPPDEGDFEAEEQFAEAEDAYWERHDAVVLAPEHSVGLLYLCDLGCALREVIVVSGPSRGQMWADDRADGGGFRPLLQPDGNRRGFAGWYRGWLDETEQQLQA